MAELSHVTHVTGTAAPGDQLVTILVRARHCDALLRTSMELVQRKEAADLPAALSRLLVVGTLNEHMRMFGD